jgi:hypothetical protein
LGLPLTPKFGRLVVVDGEGWVGFRATPTASIKFGSKLEFGDFLILKNSSKIFTIVRFFLLNPTTSHNYLII